MGKLKIHGGDFLKGNGHFLFGAFSLPTKNAPLLGETIKGEELEFVTVASEENVKKFFRTVGMSILGGFSLGPIGALAGLLAGGRKKEITFIAKFKDGRKLLATTDKKTFLKIQAATM